MSPVHRRLLHHAFPVVCRRQAQAEPVVHAGARGGAGSDRRRHDGLSGVAGLSKTGEVCCCRRCRCFEEHRVDFAAAHSAFIGHCTAAMATKSQSSKSLLQVTPKSLPSHSSKSLPSHSQVTPPRHRLPFLSKIWSYWTAFPALQRHVPRYQCDSCPCGTNALRHPSLCT